MVALLLLIVYSRAVWLTDLNLTIDEVRSAMRSAGDLNQLVTWQPDDWPPLHNVLLGLWRNLVGDHPVILRLSSIFFFLPSIPIAYQLGQRLTKNEQVGWSLAITYAAMGFTVYLSTHLRPYALSLTLFPLVIWLTDVYFGSERKSKIRKTLEAMLLAIGINALFYTTYTALFPFAFIGLYTLLIYGRKIWQWWLPVALSFILVLPELIRKITTDTLSGQQFQIFDTTPNISLLRVAEIIYGEFFGLNATIWYILVAVALVGLVWKQRHRANFLIWLGIGFVIGVLFVYFFLTPVATSNAGRYVWWNLFMVALFIGVGLGSLPRRVWLTANLIMVVLMFQAVNWETYPQKLEGHEDNFIWLNENIQHGDVVFIDPNFCWEECFHFDKMVYYADALLDHPMRVIDNPEGYERVWYFHEAAKTDPSAENQIIEGRINSIFIGPAEFVIQLFEAPPDPAGILFDNGLRFHGIQWLDTDNHPLPDTNLLRENDTVKVQLWWSTENTQDDAYSVSLQMLDDTGELLAQSDETPQAIHLNPIQTAPLPEDMTGWEVGQLYIEERELALSALPKGKFLAPVQLIVYQWWDGERVASEQTNDNGELSLGTMPVLGW